MALSYEDVLKAGDARLAKEKEYLESVKKQKQTYEQAPQRIEEALQTGLALQRGEAARALASNRAAFGGTSGRTLAASRGTAIQLGGEQESRTREAELQKLAAQAEADKAGTQVIEEERKLGEAQRLRDLEAQEAINKVRDIIDEESGVFWTSASDRRRMRQKFESDVLEVYKDNPVAYRAAMNEYNRLIKGNESKGGLQGGWF